MLKFQNLLPSSILKSNGKIKYVDVATRNFIVFRYAFCGHVTISNTCMYIHVSNLHVNRSVGFQEAKCRNICNYFILNKAIVLLFVCV